MAKQLILDGVVQGVFCRSYCRQYAKKMKIRGTATNLPDGTVRVVLETDDDGLIREYEANLRTNPMGYTFYGTISNISVSDYRGPLIGDYKF
jgi:acylphosphatase